MVEFRNRSCPLCGSTEVHRELAKLSFEESKIGRHTFSSRKEPDNLTNRMIICAVCDLAYADPIPQISWIRDQYVQSAFHALRESQLAAENHLRVSSEILKILPDMDGALDIGAGDGAFLRMLKATGFSNIQGVEPSIEASSRASVQVRDVIKEGFYCDSDYEENTFSLVSCFQTLEHVAAAKEISNSVFRILKPGGVFIVSVHNYRSITAKILRERSPIFDIEHLQLFSKKSLSELFLHAGFETHAIRNMRNDYPISYWLRLAPIYRPIKKVLQKTMEFSPIGSITMPLWAGNLWGYGVKAMEGGIDKG